jgi:mRNA-degrading endonuclease RelE of RelBE toxin-antitoxin system
VTHRTSIDDVRDAQVRLLENFADRLRRGEPPLPTDAMAPLVDEIELRIDGAAVVEGWTEEGCERPTEPPISRKVPVGVHEVVFLKRATRDLQGLTPEDRVAVAESLTALAKDPLPRGARALHGEAERHVQHRVGLLRLLYCIHERTITVVAVTTGPP